MDPILSIRIEHVSKLMQFVYLLFVCLVELCILQ
jgi:hypothetical protein